MIRYHEPLKISLADIVKDSQSSIGSFYLSVTSLAEAVIANWIT